MLINKPMKQYFLSDYWNGTLQGNEVNKFIMDSVVYLGVINFLFLLSDGNIFLNFYHNHSPLVWFFLETNLL